MSINHLLLYVATAVGTVLGLYFAIGLVAYVRYEPGRADEPAEDVTFAIPTIASEDVRDSLMECVEYHREMFADFDLYCLVDEGADLQAELEATDGIQTLVVPDGYACDAVAKGRAIQYFIETVVSENPEGWYAFIDDDNLVLDDAFLYEIPYHEERGYGAMNSVLQPRQGDSMLTFVMDHIRLLDDLTVFRAFTGMLGRPYVGFHGELLTARGDVLLDVGFDRHSIVEDYAFAAELIKHGIPTWQTRTHVSILSPHSVTDLLKQRSRWFIGTWNLIWSTSSVTKVASGTRLVSWAAAILAGPLAFFLWRMAGDVQIPQLLHALPFLAGAVYGTTYLYGAWQIKGWMRFPMVLSIPICITCECLSPVYAVLFSDREFTVISK